MEFRVTSFNVHCDGVQTDFSGVYEVDKVCAELEGDILVFQEVGGYGEEVGGRLGIPNSFSKHSLQMFPEIRLAEGHPRINEESTSGHVLVATTFPVLERRELELGGYGGDPREKVLALMLQIGEERVWLVAVHLTTGLLPYGSFRQLQRLRTVLPEGPMVIAGDHNLWHPPAKYVLGEEFSRAVEGKTWPAPRARHQIDHIWARGLEVVSGSVLPATPSDHHPVTASFRIKNI
jgi:endonuclease/exonuclease/phosphatase family metal-dependent hydrolase